MFEWGDSDCTDPLSSFFLLDGFASLLAEAVGRTQDVSADAHFDTSDCRELDAVAVVSSTGSLCVLREEEAVGRAKAGWAKDVSGV